MSALVCTSVTQNSALCPSSRVLRLTNRARRRCPRARSARVDLGDGRAGVREVDHELLEERRRRSAGARTPRQRLQASGGVAGALDDPAPELREAVGPDERQVGAGRDRIQILGRAGVLLGIAALDVGRPVPHHFAEPVLALDDRVVPRPIRNIGYSETNRSVSGGGDEAGEPAAVVHVDAERLEIAADDVGAVARRRLEHAQRDRVDADHGHGARLAGQRRRAPRPGSRSRRGSRASRGTRTRLSPTAHPGLRSSSSSPVCASKRNRLELHPRLAVALDQRATLGSNRRRHERGLSPGDVAPPCRSTSPPRRPSHTSAD